MSRACWTKAKEECFGIAALADAGADHDAEPVNTWSRSRLNPTVPTGTHVTLRLAPHLRKCSSDACRSLL